MGGCCKIPGRSDEGFDITVALRVGCGSSGGGGAGDGEGLLLPGQGR